MIKTSILKLASSFEKHARQAFDFSKVKQLAEQDYANVTTLIETSQAEVNNANQNLIRQRILESFVRKIHQMMDELALEKMNLLEFQQMIYSLKMEAREQSRQNGVSVSLAELTSFSYLVSIVNKMKEDRYYPEESESFEWSGESIRKAREDMLASMEAEKAQKSTTVQPGKPNAPNSETLVSAQNSVPFVNEKPIRVDYAPERKEETTMTIDPRTKRSS